MHWIYNSFRKNKNLQINRISIHEDSCINNTNLISKIKKMEYKYGPLDLIPNEQFEIYDILTKSLDRLNDFF